MKIQPPIRGKYWEELQVAPGPETQPGLATSDRQGHLTDLSANSDL